MTIGLIANMGHAMWQDLTLFSNVQGSAQVSVVTTPLLTGLEYSHVVKFAGHATVPGQISIVNFTVANHINVNSITLCLLNVYLRWTNIAPTTEYRFLTIDGQDTFGTGNWHLILETDGDIRVVDDNGSTVATISDPLTVNTWHRLEINFRTHGSQGRIQIWLDGVEILSNQADLDTGSQSLSDFFHIEGPKDVGDDMFYAAHFLAEAAQGDVWDADFEIIGPYQVTDLASATPDTGPGGVPGTPAVGDDLDVGNWDDAMETPTSTSPNIQYRTDPSEGGVFLDSGTRAGPSGDSRIDGDSNIITSQTVFFIRRDFGGLNTHNLVAGNKTDEYDAATVFSPTNILQGSYAPFTVMTAAAGAMPKSTEFGLIGFGIVGARELFLGDVAMFLLHKPSAGGTQTDKTINFSTITGMALTKFPIRPKAIAFGMVTGVARSLVTSKPLGVGFVTGMGIVKETQKTFSVGFATAMVTTTLKAVFKTFNVAFGTAMAATPVPIFRRTFNVAFATAMALVKQTQKTFAVSFPMAVAVVKETRVGKAVSFVTGMTVATAILTVQAVAFGLATSMSLAKVTSKVIGVAFATAMSVVKETRRTFSVGFTTAFALAKTTKPIKAVSFVTSMVLTRALQLSEAISFSAITTMVATPIKVILKSISVAFVTAMSTVTDFTAGSGVFGRALWLIRRRRR